MRKEAAESPWGAAAFVVVALMLVFLIVDRLGVFAPGPVLRNLQIHVTLDPLGATALFRVEGDKTTNDTLRARVASWIFSDGTGISVPLPGAIQNRQEGDHFLSQEYTAIIPPAVRTDAGAVLRVCFVYDPGMVCVEKPFSEISP